MSTTRLMLADRRLPFWVALLTLAATWIGGGYLNGTAEAVYDSDYGLVWCQAPWCYAVSLMVGGIFFARPMRDGGYRTMLDLFDRHYGPRVTAVLFVPALVGDLFWTAAILSALGKTLHTMTGLAAEHVMVASMLVVVGYTVWGGLWSVAISDIVQLALVVVGLVITVPFALHATAGVAEVWHEYAQLRGDQARLWPGRSAWSGETPWGWQWLDSALLLILGGVPWQVYFQRILACKTARAATWMSVVAGLVCLLVALVPMLIGMIATTVQWPTPPGPPPDAASVLPHVLQYLTPHVVGMLGLTALVCAVMSSMDSSILASASMFAWNIYRPLSRQPDDSPKIARILRVAVLLVSGVALLLAFSVDSVYQLWFLCADLVYVILFPQLTMALFWPHASRRGAIAGIVMSVALRTVIGLMSVGYEPLARLANATEYWPRLSLAVLTSLVTIGICSKLAPDKDQDQDQVGDRMPT